MYYIRKRRHDKIVGLLDTMNDSDIIDAINELSLLNCFEEFTEIIEQAEKRELISKDMILNRKSYIIDYEYKTSGGETIPIILSDKIVLSIINRPIPKYIIINKDNMISYKIYPKNVSNGILNDKIEIIYQKDSKQDNLYFEVKDINKWKVVLMQFKMRREQ
jgi:hypothetical protein